MSTNKLHACFVLKGKHQCSMENRVKLISYDLSKFNSYINLGIPNLQPKSENKNIPKKYEYEQLNAKMNPSLNVKATRVKYTGSRVMSNERNNQLPEMFCSQAPSFSEEHSPSGIELRLRINRNTTDITILIE